jgi:hypothetical protein
MDRRLDERYQTNLPVTVTDIAVPHRVASGQIVNMSHSGACATLSLRLDPGAIVKLQVGDSVLFGHVEYCDQGRTYIEVVRVLIGESDLCGSVNAVLAAVMPNVPGVRVISAR